MEDYGFDQAFTNGSACPDSECKRVIREKDQLIERQFLEIKNLKRELKLVVTERDSLLCDVNKLKFELEMADLIRLKDGRIEASQVRMSTSHGLDKPPGSLSSSPQKPERPPCGPGPRQSCSRRGTSEPGPVSKSYSLDGGAGGTTPPGRGTMPRGRSGSYQQSHQGKSRVSPRTNDEVLKKTRMQGYELSPDLADKQLEMLERKYGGAVRARNAALTIQRAFRRYAMMRKFSMITQQAKQEKRLSRRFQTVDLAATNGDGWLVGASTPSGEWDRSANRSCDATDPELIIKNNNLSQMIYSEQCSRAPRPSRSQSLKESRVIDGQTKEYDSAYPSGLRSNAYHHPGSPKTDGWYEGSLRTPKGSDAMLSGWYEEDDSVYHTPCWGGATQESPVVSEQSYHTPRESLSTDSGISSLHEANALRHGSPFGDLLTRRRGSKNFPPQTPPSRRTPPEVPRRTSSIGRGDNMSGDVASLSSGGSDSSLSLCADRGTPSTEGEGDQSPVPASSWKRKTGQTPCELSSQLDDKRLSNISETSEDSIEHSSTCNHAHCHTYQTTPPSHSGSIHSHSQPLYKVPEVIRKRQYRVGLNLFNKKPEKGINYLIRRGFLDSSPQSVAKFLISRKGLSKQMIGEYLGNLQNSFNMSVLECFASELSLSGLQVDVALRRFQTFFRLPGEAQKIERLVEVFAQRYCQCNRDVISRLCSPDTIFVLAFAVIMLNTDLHTPNIKPERKMKPEDFVKNLRGIDEGNDIDKETLLGIYERIRSSEFKPGSDHVTQVMKVQQTIVGKKPHLALPHRRLVCYCRLYEVPDINKKERPGVHQREVFLFNDLLVVTKIFSKKKNSVTYSFRQSFSLCGLQVSTFQVPYYSFGIKLATRVDNKVLITFNARNEHDRSKFVEDLKESVCEMDEMENLRIEAGLERQQRSTRMRTTENRDSGVADIEVLPNGKESTGGSPTVTTNGATKNGSQEAQGLKRSALSNSLLDIHDIGEKPQRRGSIGSLDSGMSVSFQSSSNSTVSRDSSPQAAAPPLAHNKSMPPQQSSFLRLFDRNKKDTRAASKSDSTSSTETCA